MELSRAGTSQGYTLTSGGLAAAAKLLQLCLTL